MSEIIFLETQDLILINQQVIKSYGGTIGIRDNNLLESALHSPKNLYFYQNADFYQMASGYAFSIIQNHPFLDGNKRTGFASMNAFLELNNIKLQYQRQETVEMMVKIATKEVDFDGIVKWLKSNKLNNE